MTAYLLLVHIFNLLLPAAALACVMGVLGGRLAGARVTKPLVASRRGRLLWAFGVNVAVLVSGLAWFRADGKMATYGAMVLASVLCQFVIWRGWRR